MRDLIRELIPHAPQHGLFVAPDIPDRRLENALEDYARGVRPSEVVALYDATLLGSGKDGAVFLDDRFIFQNNDLESPQTVRYEDLIHIDSKRKLLGGRRIELGINRGRATIETFLDFSGRPGGAEYIARFLNEAMLQAPTQGANAAITTDLEAVRAALTDLVDRGLLSPADRTRMLRALES